MKPLMSNVMHKIIFTSLALLSLSASADESNPLESIVEYQRINSSIGQFRFELKILDARSNPIYGEIAINTMDGKAIQTIPVESSWFNPRLDFIDLNDDGYTDLLFYNTQAGFGLGPTPGADVFLYIPKLGKFIKSETLTGKGVITKVKAKGCVNVNYKSSMAGYTDEEWCFNLKTGHWKMVKSTIN
jgi:hypothetical protein